MPKKVVERLDEAAAISRWPVLVTGDVGVGKSIMAALAYRDWSGPSAKFLSAADAVSVLKRGEFGGVMIPGCAEPQSDVQLLRSWCERTTLLVLDDLTNGLSHQGSKDALWRIINARAGRPAIYTANGSPDELADFFGASLSDRLFQGTTIIWPGKSRRKGVQHIV